MDVEQDIKNFKIRFGEYIPDHVLKMLFEDEFCGDVLRHDTARELAFIIVREVAVILNGLTVKTELIEIQELSIYKPLLEGIAVLLKENPEKEGIEVLEEQESLDGVFEKIEKTKDGVLRNSLYRYEFLNRFYKAYKSEIGQEIRGFIKDERDKGLAFVFGGRSNVISDYLVAEKILKRWEQWLKERLELQRKIVKFSKLK